MACMLLKFRWCCSVKRALDDVIMIICCWNGGLIYSPKHMGKLWEKWAGVGVGEVWWSGSYPDPITPHLTIRRSPNTINNLLSENRYGAYTSINPCKWPRIRSRTRWSNIKKENHVLGNWSIYHKDRSHIRPHRPSPSDLDWSVNRNDMSRCLQDGQGYDIRDNVLPNNTFSYPFCNCLPYNPAKSFLFFIIHSLIEVWNVVFILVLFPFLNWDDVKNVGHIVCTMCYIGQSRDAVLFDLDGARE